MKRQVVQVAAQVQFAPMIAGIAALTLALATDRTWPIDNASRCCAEAGKGAPLKLSAQGIFGFRVTVAINSAAQFVLARRTY
jgi:hypothetical protein